jgi:hypothetical protein
MSHFYAQDLHLPDRIISSLVLNFSKVLALRSLGEAVVGDTGFEPVASSV